MGAINSIVCDKHKAACVYIGHHKKGREENKRDKLAGATGIPSSVRAVYTVERISECVCRITPSQENTLGHIASTYRSVLIEEEDGSFGISITPEIDQEQAGAVSKAEKFLIGLFKEKTEFEAADIYRIGEEQGLSGKSLKRAKAKLPVKVYRKAVPGPWFWECSLYYENRGFLEKTPKTGDEKSNNINKGAKEDKNPGGSTKTAQGGQGGQEGQEKNGGDSWKKDNDIKTVPKNISHISEITKRNIEIIDTEESPWR